MSIFADAEAEFAAIWDSIKHVFHDDVKPAIETFLKQFSTEFGLQAVTAALAAVATLETGTPFGGVAVGLANTLIADAKADAASTALLDANQILQTVQSALQVAKVANSVQTPADKTAAATIAAPATDAPAV
ncbi:MAG: hypothetical protein JWN34_365 [Bryobacterales bacterium]|nr:hypothetical protein [Bryobacterales bacterium]